MKQLIIVALLVVPRFTSAQDFRLSLADAMVRAPRATSAAAQGHARGESARSRAGMARAGVLPTVDGVAFTGERTTNLDTFGVPIPGIGGVTPPAQSTDLRVRVAIPVIPVDGIARWRAAVRATDAGVADSTTIARAAMYRAAHAYVTALRADALLNSRLDEVRLAQELAILATHQQEAGVGIALDVTRAESQHAAARAAAAAMRADRDVAFIELRRLTGSSAASELTLTTALDPFDALPSAGGATAIRELGDVAAAAHVNRSELQAATADRDAASLSVRASQAAWLPSASFVLEQGAIGSKRDRMYNTYSYGVQLSVPIFDGMKRSAQWNEAKANAGAASARVHELEQEIEAEVNAAQARLRALEERGLAAVAGVRLADEALRQATSRFEAGLAGNADVIEAQQARTRAHSELVEAMAARQHTRIALAAARGEVVLR